MRARCESKAPCSPSADLSISCARLSCPPMRYCTDQCSAARQSAAASAPKGCARLLHASPHLFLPFLTHSECTHAYPRLYLSLSLSLALCVCAHMRGRGLAGSEGGKNQLTQARERWLPRTLRPEMGESKYRAKSDLAAPVKHAEPHRVTTIPVWKSTSRTRQLPESACLTPAHEPTRTHTPWRASRPRPAARMHVRINAHTKAQQAPCTLAAESRAHAQGSACL